MFELQSGSDLDRKAFSGRLETVTAKAMEYNRVDVLENIANFLKKEKIPETDNIIFSEKDALNKILEARTIGAARSDNENRERLLETHPQPPKEAIRIHGQSLEIFLNAKSGQAFTGLVHIREKGEYKMFIAPISPSQGNRDTPDKIYAVREHQTDVPYSIYQKRNINFSPIEHFRVIDGKPRPCHAQFAKLIGEKYASDTPEEGKFIGFSVIKGRITDGVTNQYAFVSRTANPFTFKDEKGKEGDRVLPPGWQSAIKRTLDRTSIMEYSIRKVEQIDSEAQSKDYENKIPSLYVDQIKDLINHPSFASARAKMAAKWDL
ncbi:hypothetical protein [Dictyobacter arantiisoli]|uniref:Uncharacterized protein n=1 Tax=Dictyobacter arantiisoli TaxID=2014874 RepID=A0A5A5T9N2_9CHLR|nr:hypothetical protein [Dictyobacter arantiisoli]GCF07733.1 hypothetical protein KDI_12970 [Dictyobacter arantiisoli]